MDRYVNLVKKGEKLAKPELFEINSQQYSSKELFPVLPVEVNHPSTLTLTTITGFIDYINENVDSLNSEELIIHVESYSMISLISKLTGEYKQRMTYLNSIAKTHRFSFGQKYNIENFIISLQANFEQTDDRDKVLKIVGNVQTQAIKAHKDDGISQSVTAKVGISSLDDAEVPNPVTLKPFRTFLEVDQPESKFVLRLSNNDDGLLCALYEADGGKWQTDAIYEIKKYLALNIKDIAIIA